MEDLKKLAQKYPKVRIVMNHFGATIGPKMKPEALEKFHWDCSAVPPQKRFAKKACANPG